MVAGGGHGLTPGQLDVAVEILSNPNSTRANAALSGSAAMVLMDLVNPRIVPDLDIHLPGFPETVQVLRTVPQALREQGYEVRSDWSINRALHHQRQVTLHIRTPAGEEVEVDVGRKPRPHAPVWAAARGDGTTALLLARPDAIPEVSDDQMLLTSPIALAQSEHTPDGRVISGDELSILLQRDRFVLATNPRELVFRKVHSFMFNEARSKVSDMVDVDGLINRVGIDHVVRALGTGGDSRGLPADAIKLKFARAIGRALDDHDQRDEYPIPAEEVGDLRERLRRSYEELSWGTSRAAHSRSSVPPFRARPVPGRRPRRGRPGPGGRER